jgi:hypothetical protein
MLLSIHIFVRKQWNDYSDVGVQLYYDDINDISCKCSENKLIVGYLKSSILN